MIWSPRVITLDVKFGDEPWWQWRGAPWPAIVRRASAAMESVVGP